jgi:hypothetical protein
VFATILNSESVWDGSRFLSTSGVVTASRRCQNRGERASAHEPGSADNCIAAVQVSC